MADEVTDPNILALLNGDAAPAAQPQAVSDPALLQQLEAAPADVVQPRPQLQPSVGFLGADNSADATPNQIAIDNSSAGRVLDAFKQGARDGWGDQPIGLSEESLRYMNERGALVPLEDAWKAPVTFFNEMLMQSGAVAFDLATRGFTAATHAAGGSIAQIAGEVAGETKTDYLAANLSEFFDVAGLYAGGVAPSPKASFEAPKVAPRIDIAEARNLGATLGEGEYAGSVPVGKLSEAELNAGVPPVAATVPAPVETPGGFAVDTGTVYARSGPGDLDYADLPRQEIFATDELTAAATTNGVNFESAMQGQQTGHFVTRQANVGESAVSRDYLGDDGNWYPVGKLQEIGAPKLYATADEAVAAAKTEAETASKKYAADVVTTPDAPILPPAPSKVEVPIAPVQKFDDMPVSDGGTKLNLKYNSSAEVQDFIRQQAIEAGDYTTERRSGTSWVETERLGQALGVTPAEIMKRQIGDIQGASWMDAATNTVIQKTTELRELWQKAASGTDADKIAALNAEAEHSVLMGSILGNEAEVGRALNIIKKFKAATQEARDVSQLIKDNGGLENISERARLGSLLDTPQQVSRFVNDAMKPKLSGMLQELWINGLLSGLVTHAKNLAGNMTVALWRTTESGVAAGIGLARGLPEDRVYLGEPVQRAYAFLHSGPEMLKAGWKAWKEDADTGKLDTGKFQQIPSATITVAGHKFQVGGKQIRIPGRALAAMDGAFKTLAYRQSIAAQAWRRAAKASAEDGEVFSRNLSKLNQFPTAGMVERASKEAELQTLSQPLGSTGRAIQTIANHNLLTKMIAPFVKFGINSAKFAGERSIFSLLNPEIRSILKGEKGAAARDEQIAKIAVGSAVSATAIYMASQGMVTGGGPKDPAERATKRALGWAPYSFKVGGLYYAGNWNDPASTLFFAAADMYEIGNKIGEEDASTIAQLMMASVVNNITSKSYFQGVSDSVELLNDPVRYGQQWLDKQAGTIIPTGVAQAARLQDPYLRDARTIMDTLKSRLPKTPLNPEFNSESVYPVRDVWGNAIKREGALGPDAISPIYTNTEKNDPILKELDSLGLYPAKLDRQIRGVDLDARQYDDYQRLAGRLLRYRLDYTMNAMPSWGMMAPGVRKEIMGKVINDTREIARKYMLMYYPGILQEATRNKIDSLTGVAP